MIVSCEQRIAGDSDSSPSRLDHSLLRRHVNAVRASQSVDERQIADGGKVLFSEEARN